MTGQRDASIKSCWFLYLGGVRPGIGRSDSAEMLLQKLKYTGGLPALVLAKEGDRIVTTCRSLGVPVDTIPPVLLGRRSTILEALATDAGQHALEDLCRQLSGLQPDWALSFYSPWIPSALSGVPKNYFINFHPGKLPDLRGYEPDTWAILLGMQENVGCLHKLTSGYDEGDIGWQTSGVSIATDDTSASVLCNVTSRFIDEARQWWPLAATGQMMFSAQGPAVDEPLTSLRLEQYRRIDFFADSHEGLSRKIRAFLCHAGESAWLSGTIGGRDIRITSIVLGHVGHEALSPGTIISTGVMVADGVVADCRIKTPDGWATFDYLLNLT
jgi:methionyl-tRNA formyltransferase